MRGGASLRRWWVCVGSLTFEDRLDNLANLVSVSLVVVCLDPCGLVNTGGLNNACIDAIEHVRDLANICMCIQPELDWAVDTIFL